MNKSGSEGLLSPTEKSNSISIYEKPVARARTWVLYFADWIVVIAAIVVSQLIMIPWPYSVSFIVTDPTIQQSHFKDTFDITRACVVLCTAIPIVVMILWLGYFRFKIGDIHISILGLGMALGFCTLFTAIFKQMTVIMSSDFLDRCQLDPADYDRSFRTGARLSFHLCKGPDTVRGARYFPAYTVTLPACALGYLSLFFSLHLGVWAHPQVRHQVRELSTSIVPYRGRPGQTLVAFISLLPFAAGMTFAALETKFHGSGNGWGNAGSVLLGILFAIWGHITYCYDMQGALVAYMYE